MNSNSIAYSRNTENSFKNNFELKRLLPAFQLFGEKNAVEV
jgi:hypothetical protein